MIKSMTGFGRCEVQKDSRKVHGGTEKCEPSVSRRKYPDAEETEFLRDRYTDTFKVLCKQGQGGYLYYLRRSLPDTGVSEI